MHRSFRLLAAGSLLALTPAVLPGIALGAIAGPAAPAAATLTIDAINDMGAPPAPVDGAVIGLNGNIYLSANTASSISLPDGTYEVAAVIASAAHPGGYSVVAQTVTMSGASKVVTLDATGEVQITSKITGAGGATQDIASDSLCTGGNTLIGIETSAGQGIYVKPLSASHVQMVYQTVYRATNSTTFYEVAGSYGKGIPASPAYSASVGSMAKVRLQLRANENVNPLSGVITGYAGCGSLDLPVITRLGTTDTDYRTPGAWNTNLDFGPVSGPVERDLFRQRTYKAGHSYTDIFDGAVTGPAAVYPVVTGATISYPPGELMTDPNVRTGFNCEGQATVVLTHSGKKVKSASLDFCAAHPAFSAHASKPGWYNLTATATRWNAVPNTTTPASLSSKISMAWRFRFAKVPGSSEAMAVTVPDFQPAGLSIANTVKGGSTTTVKLRVARGGGQSVTTPKYGLKTVKVQVYFSTTKKWSTVKLSKHGGYWLFKVKEPITGALVSLRAIVTDHHGDSTTETITDAYGVAGT